MYASNIWISSPLAVGGPAIRNSHFVSDISISETADRLNQSSSNCFGGRSTWVFASLSYSTHLCLSQAPCIPLVGNPRRSPFLRIHHTTCYYCNNTTRHIKCRKGFLNRIVFPNFFGRVKHLSVSFSAESQFARKVVA